ncbi:2Fe-2S iron-sulfur cluster-binding protein [Arthrobacter sp. L77]|uniref:2Fe-2S iron-sulfur cluster-binding protein n=1 Tax=Arthrobacter sp. L77 TaxID=1496689 RepID=UPI000692103A|nr:2Fe-2S iron-sulfur cluster-binding protein [Arthrobacter sp. L77]
MNDPQIWWYVTRASAMVAWTLLTVSAIWGILLSTRFLRAMDNPGWLHDLHRWMSGAALLMTGLHMISLMLDSWAAFSLAELLVPFAAEYRPIPVALGLVAFYLLIAVQGSSLLMHRLPRRFWKGLHYASYAAVMLVSFHAGFSGSDTGAWIYRLTAILLVLLFVAATLLRILAPGTAASTPGAASRGREPAAPDGATDGAGPRTAVVRSSHPLADGVLSIRLGMADGEPLPPWEPGAHITLHLPIGIDRQYSLCGDPATRDSYSIAVRLAESSRGGSRWLHEHAQAGRRIDISGPRNHFRLVPAQRYLFIAAGIGITPLKPMIESLPPGREWELIHLGRTRTAMPYQHALASTYPRQVHLHARDEHPGRFDLAAAINARRSDTEVYVCGPEALLEEAADLVPAGRLHLERFSPLVADASTPARPVDIICGRSGKEVHVPADVSVLHALQDQAIPIAGSCGEGLCGTCEVRVLGGSPHHLDSIRDEHDRRSPGVMYPCVSRALTPTLTLDI